MNSMNAGNLLNTAWLLPFALALHEIEEWNIHGWYVRNYVDLPEGRTPTTIRFFLVFLSLLGFFWFALAVVWGDSSVCAWIILPLVALIVQNVFQHLYWQFLFKQYAPGIVTAVFLLMPLCGYIVFECALGALVPLWYLIVLGVLMVPGMVETVKVRNRLTRSIMTIHKFSRASVNWIGLTIGSAS
jgi:hypothetical protein